jgi:hypothetical protein
MKNQGWEKQERGWYTKEGVGGVCKENDGRWYIYPLPPGLCGASFPTMQEAINYIESDKVD